MVIDTSILLAVLQDEPERREFNEALEAAPTRLMSTANFVETSMIIESRFGAEGTRDLDLLVSRAGITLVPVDEDQAYISRQAFRNFGKGRHAARLNFGDCFAYALAKTLGEPLMFKGEDFSRTDIDAYSG